MVEIIIFAGIVLLLVAADEIAERWIPGKRHNLLKSIGAIPKQSRNI